MEVHNLAASLVIGAGATFLVDLWNALLKRAYGIRSLDYCLLGRWIRHIPQGTLRHVNITEAPPKPYECAVGWIAHYTIGVALTLLFVVFTSGDWLAHPTLLPALLFGIGTVIFPFFILQPSFGLGIASANFPNPTKARRKSLMTHAVFGAGVWVCAHTVNFVLRILA